MRDLFHLIIIALMSFAVVGIAMVYSRDGDLGGSFRSVTASIGDKLSDVSALIGGPDSATTPDAPQTYPVTIKRPNGAQWIGLAGLPDQTEVAFPVPRGGHYISAALDLSFDTQLTDSGDGLLTVSVNGTPRGQIVLDSGHATHQARIELTQADLSGSRIVLHLAGRGTTGSGQICPTDAANSGSAVTLSPESRLELVSSQPLTDAIGQLAAAAPLALTSGTTPQQTALAIWANQQLNRGGIASHIGTPDRGETAVSLVAHAASLAGLSSANQLVGHDAVNQLIAAAGASLPAPTAWPVSVADLGAETTVKSFRGSRRWTVPFAAADLPGGKLPEQFGVRLKVTPLSDNADWVVRVTLNGNLLDSRRFAGSSDSISFDVPLPPERLLPRNGLTVELVDTTPNEGICRRAPDAQAQLLPESALTDSATASADWAQLIERLAATPTIAIAASDGLRNEQAAAGSALVSLLLPRQAKVTFDGDAPVTLKIVDRPAFARALAELPSGQTMTAVLPASTAVPLQVLAVPSATLGQALELLGPDDVFVLVTGR